MPFLNASLQVLMYEDTDNNRNPLIRMPDITKSIQGVPVNNDRSDRITLYANDVKDLATTSRSLLWDSTTELAFSLPISTESKMRVQWTGTGTNPIFRTKRAIGGSATTTVSITELTPYVKRITNIGGTAWNTASVQVNDLIRFERNTDAFTSPFISGNVGQTWLVQAKGANYIDFIDNGQAVVEGSVILGADFDLALRVMSPGPVKMGDIMTISSTAIHPSNNGKFEIIDISTDYIEVVNPLAVTETKVLGAYIPTIYEYLIGFVLLRASGPFKIKFDNQSEWAKIDRVGPEALFMASMSAHSIQASNDGPDPVTISIQYARVL
jgi:hypothetical protein